MVHFPLRLLPQSSHATPTPGICHEHSVTLALGPSPSRWGGKQSSPMLRAGGPHSHARPGWHLWDGVAAAQAARTESKQLIHTLAPVTVIHLLDVVLAFHRTPPDFA